MQFSKPALIKINNVSITDHNRSPLGITPVKIETATRMWDGTMRIQHIATKHTFSVSWTDVPAHASSTVDGFSGALDIRSTLDSANQFTMAITNGDSSVDTYVVRYIDCIVTLSKRGAYDLYNLSLALEEI